MGGDKHKIVDRPYEPHKTRYSVSSSFATGLAFQILQMPASDSFRMVKSIY